MGIKIGPKRDRVIEKVHGPTGVAVEFIRIGHLAKGELAFTSGLNPGSIIKHLVQPGVGVRRWTGVQMTDGNEAPYSVAALEAAIDADEARVREEATAAAKAAGLEPGSPEAREMLGKALDRSFGAWLNDELLSLNGIVVDAAGQAHDSAEVDAAGK